MTLLMLLSLASIVGGLFIAFVVWLGPGGGMLETAKVFGMFFGLYFGGALLNVFVFGLIGPLSFVELLTAKI